MLRIGITGNIVSHMIQGIRKRYLQNISDPVGEILRKNVV
jgi:hypothetical protein